MRFERGPIAPGPAGDDDMLDVTRIEGVDPRPKTRNREAGQARIIVIRAFKEDRNVHRAARRK